MAVRFEADVQGRLRARLMKKGLEIATLLSDVLAGLDRSSALRALAVEPGEKPEEKLRRYLDHVESRRKLLDAGDDRFGRCEVCGVDLGVMALQEMPWADRCPRHHD